MEYSPGISNEYAYFYFAEFDSIILENSEVNPSLDNNELILSCIDHYHYDYAVLLLKDSRVDSSLHDFFLINNANAYDLEKLAVLFFYDQKNNVELKNNFPNIYSKYKIQLSVSNF